MSVRTDEGEMLLRKYKRWGFPVTARGNDGLFYDVISECVAARRVRRSLPCALFAVS